MNEITQLLEAVRKGDTSARDALFAQVYDELSKLARIRLARESTLTDIDTSSLVSESYLRLTRGVNIPGANRRAFFAYAAKVMRSVVVDYVRERNAIKRGDGEAPITLLTREADPVFKSPDIERLHDALNDLRRIDERCSQVVELRFFGGLVIEEIAEVLEVSPATVRRDWDKARAFLYSALST